MLTPDHRRLADGHIDALARKHRIQVRRTKTWHSSEAVVSSRQVFIPSRTRTAMDYMAALHEIGHLVDPAARSHDRHYDTSTGRRAGYELLIVEAAAWAWAVRAARPAILKTLSRAEWRRIGNCWASHVGPVW